MQADLRKYLEFEKLITTGVDREFAANPSRELRRLVLRIRVAVQKYWIEAGNSLPACLDWDDPDEQQPIRASKLAKQKTFPPDEPPAEPPASKTRRQRTFKE